MLIFLVNIVETINLTYQSYSGQLVMNVLCYDLLPLLLLNLLDAGVKLLINNI